MAMLAEPRRKQKWTLNPRGKEWSEDSNKFGQKMLEKMGWTSGKGLGAKEQGMTEHLRVAVKNDTTGVGFNSAEMDEAWTEHQDNFNDFLKQLQQSQNTLNTPQTAETKTEQLSGKSLEQKSKQSRARVHYQKFTRGKDVNRYSSKDLANIFGQKDLNTDHSLKVKTAEVEDSSEPIGTQVNRGGVITINSGSMADYFKRKGQDISGFNKNKKCDRSNDSESEPEYVGFGFSSGTKKDEDQKDLESSPSYAFSNPCLRIDSPESNTGSVGKVKSSKKRKNETVDNNEFEVKTHKKLKSDSSIKSSYENCFVNPALNLQSKKDEECNGKEFEVSRAQFGLANSALDLTDEVKDKKRVTFNDRVEYSTDSEKKKKGKATLDKFEVENKKLKKKRKRDTVIVESEPIGIVNEALDFEEVSEEVNDNEVNERKSKKSKKRKDRRPVILETIVETPEEDKDIYIEKIVEVDVNAENNNITLEENVSKKDKKKKKKKKKEKVKNDAEVNDADDLEEVMEIGRVEGPTSNINDIVEENNSKEKKKKKKRKHIDEQPDIPKKDTNATDNASLNEKSDRTKEEKEISDKENATGEQEDSAKPKKRKKNKKERKSLEDSADNSVPEVESAKTDDVVIVEPEVKAADTTANKNNANTPTKITRSPWNEKAKMSKRLLKSLFHRNSVTNFPGSNIHEIKGYGVNVQ